MSLTEEKDWFIGSGTPARDSSVLPLVDGNNAWREVLQVINGAKTSINLAFWMLSLDHELQRPAPLEFKDPKDRQANTLHDILLNKIEAGVKVRVLLWILPTIPATQKDWLKLLTGSAIIDPFAMLKAAAHILLAPPSVLATLDMTLISYALRGKLELLLEPHPTSPIGSWHQKTIVVDSKTAFVGGMNARENDWDDMHFVYDYNRTPHATSGAARTQMQANKTLPKFPPRHDFMTRIEGEAVKDVQNNFVQRWNQCIDDDRFLAYNAHRMAGNVNISMRDKPRRAQIVRTMPKYKATPMGERGCYDAYVKAIRNAEQYIYIEDQYFRSQQLSKEIAAACTRNPKLIVIVVTIPDKLADIELLNLQIGTFSSYWTAQAADTIAKVVPDFCLFTLKRSDKDAGGNQIYVQVDIHAKMMIVDDKWYTIGSCNVNDRGFNDEGEINVTVFDPPEALKLRRYLFSEHMQVACPADFKAALKLWYDHAAKNVQAEKDGKKPPSNVFSFWQNGPLLPIVPSGWL